MAKYRTPLPDSVAFDLLEGSVRLLAENERLEADNGRLARLEQRRAELLAKVSHDLRTPLTGIIGFADLLLSEGAEDAAGRRRQECLDAIRRNGLSLLSLINDLLDAATLERGQFTIRRETVSLVSLLDDVRAATESQLSAGGCVVLWPRRDGIEGLTADIDRRRMAQAVCNLIDNARKACGHGGRIVVGFDQGPEDTVFSVADTGPGVADGDRERIFDPFVRLDLPGQPSTGFGLGLSIVKAVVDQHHGRIELDSRPGHGARFALVIPRRPPTLDAPGGAAPSR